MPLAVDEEGEAEAGAFTASAPPPSRPAPVVVVDATAVFSNPAVLALRQALTFARHTLLADARVFEEDGTSIFNPQDPSARDEDAAKDEYQLNVMQVIACAYVTAFSFGPFLQSY